MLPPDDGMEQDHRKRRLGSPVPSSGSAAQKRKLSNLVNSSSSHGGRNGSSPAAAAAAISGLVTPSTGAFEDDPDETEDENEEAEENALDAALGLENGFIEVRARNVRGLSLAANDATTALQEGCTPPAAPRSQKRA